MPVRSSSRSPSPRPAPFAQQPTPAPAAAKPDDKKEEEKPKEPKWDVTAEFGPTSTVAFDTSEGTWMNVDVSPDGARVVFDLLGDLYVMPIGGSTAAAPATRLTTGPAFDMQPRFSPDGKRIAFTSDRGGLFNIWVMDADGKNPTAVSREEKWWVNSPTWAPDGDFIFARKHFVSTRSLGAGEVWMYHRSGADGVQVTEKVSFQKDAGEPALSPDGKFLYYSKDVTPSPTFEYDKNPHAGIYAIIRRELATGRERSIVSGAGGAITPRVSPDGKWLAFIRRVDTGSQLFVRSLATGAERPIFAHLDKDQQEAWTIFGPYAQYAWLPDNKGLVVWGEGKIWRVDLPAGPPAPGAPLQAGREIPFVAKVEQTITEAVRFPVTVAPDRFPVRMLRGAVVAPDGKSVVYSALGKLWIRPLPAGTPKRLTARDDLEYAPAFSADGRTIVYASWRDVDRGRIRTIGVDGSGGREVVATPGHYVEPSFSRDGQRIVYRAVGGDDVRGPDDGEQPGIFIVPAAGGAPTLVREEGSNPRFDATGTRLYFQERRGDRTVLASVTTGNAFEIVHARSENALELVPSPDGRWIAFEERWRTYVAALPQSGRPIEIGPTSKAFPVARVSRDSGWSLHWSDADTIHWTLGADLYTRDLAKTFAFARDGADKPDEPEAAGVAIGFEQAERHAGGTIALVGARIVPMNAEPGRGVIERGTIVVERNRIVADRAGGIGQRAGRGAPHRRRRQDDHPRPDRRPRARPRREQRHPGRDVLAAGRQPRLRRDHVARPVERHADGVHQERDAAGRLAARAAPVFDRHDPLRRRDAVQGGRRELRRRADAHPPDEGGRRDQRQELQPAAPRHPPDDPQGGARAGPDGRARGRLAALPEPDADHRRPHRHRAQPAGAEAVSRRRHAVLEDQGRLHADADRRLRRPDGRELLVPARRRVAERAPAGVHAARHRWSSARAAGRWRPRTTSTTC